MNTAAEIGFWKRLPPIVAEDLDSICERIGAALDDLRGKRVLVTGAGGMLASYLIHALLHLHRRGYNGPEIVALVRNRESARRRFDYAAREGLDLKIHWVEIDLGETRTWEGSADFYIHAASPASPKAFLANPIATAAINTTATDLLLSRAATRGAERFLFFSSSEVYGNLGDGDRFAPEDLIGSIDPLQPRSIYAESKRMGEAICSAWAHQREVPVNIARIFHSYGPGMRLGDDRVFADFMNQILRGKDIIMRSDGLGKRAFCYIADTITGILLILLKGEKGAAYNVGNPEGILSVAELAELLITLAPVFPGSSLPKVWKEVDPARPQSSSASVFPDISKLRALGWKPEISPEDGFRRTIKSFSELSES